MTDGRITQQGAEVWAAAEPKAHVTQQGAEVWVEGSATGDGRVTQLGAEVWITNVALPTSGDVTQLGAEVWVGSVSGNVNLPRITAKVVVRPPQVLKFEQEQAVNPHNTVEKIIPSYLYQEYQDDDNLQGFVAAYNTLAQQYLDWFNTISLPIYTGLTGSLLDWVARGLYGYQRPVISSGTYKYGPFGTTIFNEFYFNQFDPNFPLSGESGLGIANDDIYKRCLTWHFYKGDGKVFDINWLKRRVMRFLIGTNGSAPNIDNTYRISVAIDENDVVYINIINSLAIFKSGAIFNEFYLNQNMAFNEANFEVITFPAFPMAKIFKACVDAGVLELPFQYTYVVNIGN